MRLLTRAISVGAVSLALLGAKAGPERRATGAVAQLFQQSVDADRDGQFERLVVSVLLDLPASGSAGLIGAIERDSAALVYAWPVGPVGAHASLMGSIHVGAAPAGRRSFRMQFDGEEIRRVLPSRGRYALTFALLDSGVVRALGSARSGEIDPEKFGWRSAHVTRVSEVALPGGRGVRIDLAVHRADHARIEATVSEDEDSLVWRGSRVEALKPGATPIVLELEPSRSSRPALDRGTSGQVHVWDDDWQASDAFCVEAWWERRGQEWVDSSRPRKFP